jgi:hypothetical protein
VGKTDGYAVQEISEDVVQRQVLRAFTELSGLSIRDRLSSAEFGSPVAHTREAQLIFPEVEKH